MLLRASAWMLQPGRGENRCSAICVCEGRAGAAPPVSRRGERLVCSALWAPSFSHSAVAERSSCRWRPDAAGGSFPALPLPHPGHGAHRRRGKGQAWTSVDRGRPLSSAPLTVQRRTPLISPGHQRGLPKDAFSSMSQLKQAAGQRSRLQWTSRNQTYIKTEAEPLGPTGRRSCSVALDPAALGGADSGWATTPRPCPRASLGLE